MDNEGLLGEDTATPQRRLGQFAGVGGGIDRRNGTWNSFMVESCQ